MEYIAGIVLLTFLYVTIDFTRFIPGEVKEKKHTVIPKQEALKRQK